MLGQMLSWAVVILAAGVVVLGVVVPRISGATPYTVLTGSMTPHYPPGTLVVVRPTTDVAVGDVVTYQLTSGEARVVTHRVVGVSYDGAGEKRYQLQGDANEEPDPESVQPVQIRGELWYAVPWVGRLAALFTTKQHQVMVYLAAGGLFSYAAAMTVQARRDRRAATDPRTAGPASSYTRNENGAST